MHLFNVMGMITIRFIDRPGWEAGKTVETIDMHPCTSIYSACSVKDHLLVD